MSDDELLDLAPLLGLDALSPAEVDSVHRRRARADAATRAEFDRRVRDTREAMASVSSVTETAPPAALREQILAATRAEMTVVRRPAEPVAAEDTADVPASEARVYPLTRRRWAYAAAAAAVAVAVGGLGWAIGSGLSSDTTPQTPTAEKVFTSEDVRTSSGAVAGGRATLTFSESADAGVLVMNDVPPPQPGTVYQMWLLSPDGATSAGTMTQADVAPSTTAVIPHLGDATSLAFTVSPPGGSTAPGDIVAQLPLG
ncbi:anti-sigma factor [Gordonia sp. VNK1]|uniref:anti-sigma factor n=1 Tax=Gordonia oleivorans TaxID=3156618 RepID=UPI0032B56F85